MELTNYSNIPNHNSTH